MELNTAEADILNSHEEGNLQDRITNALTSCVKQKPMSVIEHILTQPHLSGTTHVDSVNTNIVDVLATDLSDAVTAVAGTSLKGDGRITTCIKIDAYNLTIALTSALFRVLNDIVKEKSEVFHSDTIVIREDTELRESMRVILVDALNHNPSSPTLNVACLKKAIISSYFDSTHT